MPSLDFFSTESHFHSADLVDQTGVRLVQSDRLPYKPRACRYNESDGVQKPVLPCSLETNRRVPPKRFQNRHHACASTVVLLSKRVRRLPWLFATRAGVRDGALRRPK